MLSFRQVKLEFLTIFHHYLILISQDKNNTGLNLKLQERLNSNPNSRCTLVSDCIHFITPGSRNVFLDVKKNKCHFLVCKTIKNHCKISEQPNIYLKDAIREDFRKTGKCNLQMAKGTFMPVVSTFALMKNSPYTKTINQG